MRQQRLQAALGEFAGVLSLQCFDEIDSTNQWLVAHPPASPTLVVAALQTAGRGRQGRSWQSPADGFYFSIGLPQPHGTVVPSALSLAVSVALAERIAGFGVAGVEVKWPNDIVVNGAKLAGILLERTQKSLIVGVGVNRHRQAIVGLPDDRCAIGLADLLPESFTSQREMIVAALATDIWQVMGMNTPDLGDWLQRQWPRWDALAGRSIEVEQADGGILNGSAAGITADGALRLDTAQGERFLYSGETRIRGGWEDPE